MTLYIARFKEKKNIHIYMGDAVQGNDFSSRFNHIYHKDKSHFMKK